MYICTSTESTLQGQGVAGTQTWVGPVALDRNGDGWQSDPGLYRGSDDGSCQGT